LKLMADDGLPHQVLWLPSFWWHYVHQVAGDETLSLNFWMGATRDERARACFAAEQAAQYAPPEDDAVGASALAAARDATTLDAAVAVGRRGPSPCPSPATDDMQLVGTDDGLVSMQLSRHIETESFRMLGEDPKHAGLFLNALAAGADVRWPAVSGGRERALGVRKHLLSVMGTAERANALLRAMTRDGRLHPGLAPPLKGPVVGTDELEVTPAWADEVEQMVTGKLIPPR